jgi:cathepsin L
VAFAAKDYSREFNHFVASFDKHYTPEERALRYQVFADNMAFIEQHNAKFARGESTFTVGVNQFADLTSDEFADLVLMPQRNIDEHQRKRQNSGTCEQSYPATSVAINGSVDWRTKGVVTPIKNQGQCGSCWSFSATGSMEGAHAISTGKLVSLSEQNLVDCSTSQGNEGCGGGWPEWAISYVIENKGIDTEVSYPYTATGPNTCQYNAANIGATMSGCHDIMPRKSEPALQSAIRTVGPISVAIDASHSSFQLYQSGIYYEPACSQTMLDHAVLAVGYGTVSSSGNSYYIVKNSWGTTWGMSGYIWMSLGRNNNCGIASHASYPSV